MSHGLPVLTSQNAQARVHVSPIIIKVAFFTPALSYIRTIDLSTNCYKFIFVNNFFVSKKIFESKIFDLIQDGFF